MNAAIITIGDELLIGQIVNSNAAFIAEACTAIGCTIVALSTIGDDAQALIDELDRLRAQAPVLILTGGLGPTHDDITKAVLTSYFHDTLVEDHEWLEHLRAWMKMRGRELSDRNAQQAMLPSTCRKLDNPLGTAPGMLFDRDGIVVISMPGVPDEMKGLMRQHVIPYLQRMLEERNESSWEYRTLYSTGIPEAYLADRIGDPATFLHGCSLAFLPNAFGVRMRIGAYGRTQEERAHELDRIEAYLQERAGRWIYGTGSTSLAMRVGELLKEQGGTVSVAESCTGGMLGAAFTDVAGSSAYFEGGILSYSNAVKVRELGVSAADIATFGAVSDVVARQMCDGVRARFGTTYGIGITGVAGPDGGTEEKPVGTVWIGIAGPTGTATKQHRFGPDRRNNRERSVAAALAMLWRMMQGVDDDV
ncbi:MAG: competence/damage-inducible protein A [Bacteroidetes bacterium]|nr:competence/damage-inducible protein A [Bacteroidota bacterium]